MTILGKFCLNITNIPQLIESPNLNQENTNSTASNKSEKDPRNFAFCFYNALKNILTMVKKINFWNHDFFKALIFKIFFYWALESHV